MEEAPVDVAAVSSESIGCWDEDQPEPVEPVSLWDAWWSGAIHGARRAAILISPFVAMLLLPGLALVHFGLGTGHGFGLPNLVLESLEVLAAVGVGGALLGGSSRLFAAWRTQALRRGQAPGKWAALYRPVRFRRRDSQDGATGESVRGPSLLGPTWIGIKWTFLLLAATSLLVVSMLTFIKSLGLASVLQMNDTAISRLPNPVVLTVGTIGVSAAYAICFGMPIGFIAGLLRWCWWRLRGRPNWERPARKSGWLRRIRTTRTASGNATRWRFLHPAPLLLGMLIQIMMVGSVGLGMYAAWRTHQRLEEAMAVAEIDDPYWRINDLMAHREPVRYAENAAVVVAEALELMPEKWPPPAPVDRRQPQTPEEDLGTAFARLSAMPENLKLDEATARPIEAELDHRREALQIARTLVHYDRGRHELVIGPTVLDTRLSETQFTRTIARLLFLDAVMRTHRGDLNAALDSCRAELVTGRSIGDEPFIISQLVRIAIGVQALQATRRVVGHGEPSDAALARLQDLLENEYYQPLADRGLRGERASMDELFRRLRHGEVPISALSDERWKPDPLRPIPGLPPWSKLMFDNYRAIALEWLNEAVSIGDGPTAEQARKWKQWDKRIDDGRYRWDSGVTTRVPALVIPALSTGAMACLRYRAELGAMAILLAAERHRQRTGAWPESVAAIDASILSDPPLDPFTGQPYQVEHRDSRLFVYSIGPNLRDEHGDYNVRKWGTKFADQDDVGAIGWDVKMRGLIGVEEDNEESGDSAAR